MHVGPESGAGGGRCSARRTRQVLRRGVAEDEHPVETLAPDGADHALADGVGPRGASVPSWSPPSATAQWGSANPLAARADHTAPSRPPDGSSNRAATTTRSATPDASPNSSTSTDHRPTVMADGTIPTVALPDATGVTRRYARLSDVWVHPSPDASCCPTSPKSSVSPTTATTPSAGSDSPSSSTSPAASAPTPRKPYESSASASRHFTAAR